MPPVLLITSRYEPGMLAEFELGGDVLLVGERVADVAEVPAHDLRRAAPLHGPHGRRAYREARSPAARLAALLAADSRIVALRAAGAELRALDDVAAEALTLGSVLDGPDRYLATRERVLGLVQAGRGDEADQIVGERAEAIRRPRIRADLLGELVWARLACGDASALVLDAVAAELAVADRQLAAGRAYGAVERRATGAAEGYAEAVRTAYHRGLHLDRTTSPLASAPSAYAEVLGASATATRIMGVDARRTPPRPTPRGGRVLVLTWANDNFVGEIVAMLEADDDAQVRVLDVASLPDATAVTSVVRLAAAGLGAPPVGPDPVGWAEQHLRPELEWADTVLLEWCTAAAALVTRVDVGDARVVVRMHSVEAYSLWPALVDWSRVDEAVFVSDHLRDQAAASIPGLRGPGAPLLSVAPLTVDLARFPVVDRPDDARFVLGVVGWSAVAKDVRWALELLTELREHDPRFRLRLVGSELTEGSSPAAAVYHRSVRALLEPLLAADAVDLVGQTDDVPAALAEVGVILSTSVRESFHAGLVEGAATGAAPVVRDWPYFAGRAHGARTLYPDSWIVADRVAAVRRILALAADPGVWREAGRSAAATVRAEQDPAASLAAYRRLLLGDA
ncbi:glycosyltransferase [Nocardioides massiliensis]|uniref:Glycosyltransferase involved in cell wall biosynthesis n=1 Tax=Nocardioides massiliensis TaxID=1325935 RepID=A0ABT9NMS3_9ACTN|nr:glycosyltransferase [Nocardioides massiliensis]MDP9821626.1 glycosyltransferase involved in cell wall biosynthesis [Nocardioides massiliensis]